MEPWGGISVIGVENLYNLLTSVYGPFPFFQDGDWPVCRFVMVTFRIGIAKKVYSIYLPNIIYLIWFQETEIFK